MHLNTNQHYTLQDNSEFLNVLKTNICRGKNRLREFWYASFGLFTQVDQVSDNIKNNDDNVKRNSNYKNISWQSKVSFPYSLNFKNKNINFWQMHYFNFFMYNFIL